jgi:hypothetical protein
LSPFPSAPYFPLFSHTLYLLSLFFRFFIFCFVTFLLIMSSFSSAFLLAYANFFILFPLLMLVFSVFFSFLLVLPTSPLRGLDRDMFHYHLFCSRFFVVANTPSLLVVNCLLLFLRREISFLGNANAIAE